MTVPTFQSIAQAIGADAYYVRALAMTLILPAYTVNGFLPCTGIKEGWFNGEAFYRWVSDELLPQCNSYPQPKSVIIMDNASIHCNQRIEQVNHSQTIYLNV